MYRCLPIILIPLLSMLDMINRSYVDASHYHQVSTNAFWLSVEPLNVDWAKGCLAAAGCTDSRLMLTHWNLASDERISASWSIQETFDESHLFISYWTKGRPSDVTFSYEVAGTDPIYGFSRTCDSTRTIRVFDNQHEESNTHDYEATTKVVTSTSTPTTTTTKTTKPIAKTTTTSIKTKKTKPKSNGESDKVTVDFNGKCFNATIMIIKYERNCPWCSCDDHIAIIGQMSDVESSDLLRHVNSPSDALLIDVGIGVLSVIALVTSAAFACILVAFLRQRRHTKNSTKSCCDCSTKSVASGSTGGSNCCCCYCSARQPHKCQINRNLSSNIINGNNNNNNRQKLIRDCGKSIAPYRTETKSTKIGSRTAGKQSTFGDHRPKIFDDMQLIKPLSLDRSNGTLISGPYCNGTLKI